MELDFDSDTAFFNPEGSGKLAIESELIVMALFVFPIDSQDLQHLQIIKSLLHFIVV